jgi:predicted enzyme related to lactoylglutathione lyase
LTIAPVVGYTVAANHVRLRSKVMGDETTFGLSAIEQIAVNAHDIERAVMFYRDRLGMKHLFTVPPNLAFFDCDGIRLMLSLPAKPEFDHPSSIIYFNVDDIQQSSQMLSARGVHFEEQPVFVADMGSYDLWLASFRDSENNLLALMSHVPKKPK